MTTVTVLIPAHNAARQIARTVVSVRTQTRQADRILVAADNCSDDTAARARAAGADVIEVSGGSKAKCQNAALPQIDTDLVLPLDDDTVLAPDYLEKLLPEFDDPRVAVAAGCVLTLTQDHWASRARMLEYLQSFHLFRPIQSISDSVVVCAGCCSVFRVSDLHAIGGFPETHTSEVAPAKRWILAHQRMTSTVNRFWSKVDSSGDGCWEWLGRKNQDGYGEFDAPSRPGRNRSELAHRFAYRFVGDIPAGSYVLHACDNPGCVRPDHLSLGDQQENMNQMYSRGRDRHASGSHNGNAKLSEAQVDEIRASYRQDSSYGRKAALARMYGVSKETVGLILAGKIWKGVDISVGAERTVPMLTED